MTLELHMTLGWNLVFLALNAFVLGSKVEKASNGKGTSWDYCVAIIMLIGLWGNGAALMEVL